MITSETQMATIMMGFVCMKAMHNMEVLLLGMAAQHGTQLLSSPPERQLLKLHMLQSLTLLAPHHAGVAGA